VQTQCAQSHLNGNAPTCCDPSVHKLCGASCCDNPLFPNCNGAGQCVQ
jgi:hypothetical protein